MSVGEIYVTVQGRVGGEVEYKDASASKVALASFRLGSTPRYYDRGEGAWADRPTTWFTVECWRTLAENVKSSVEKGQPVIVTGRLKTTEWVDDEGRRQSRTVLDAFSVGHDLARGTAAFRKNLTVQHGQSSVSLDEEMRRLSESAETAELVDEVRLSVSGAAPPSAGVTPLSGMRGTEAQAPADRGVPAEPVAAGVGSGGPDPGNEPRPASGRAGRAA